MSDATTATTPLDEAKTSSKAWWILFAMGFGALIAQMFSTVIGPALPAMSSDLNLNPNAAAWLMTAYSLAFGTALVAGGRLGDLIGEVKVIIIGFIVFGGGLLVTAIATSGGMAISGRAIQGIGIGISAPATLSIIVNTFPLKTRGLAIGTWGFAHGAGLLIGPLIGGAVAEMLSWRLIFSVTIPLTALVIFVTIVATRGYKSKLASGNYDFAGLIFGGIAITAITYGLQEAAGGITRVQSWLPLLVGVICGVIFAFVEKRIKHPLVDFGLWKERLFSGGFFAECAVGFVYIPMLVFVGSIFFIGVLGMSPSEAGLVIILTTGTCMVLEPPAGKLVDKIGPGIPIAIALLLQAVGLFWFYFFTPETTVAGMIAPLMIMGAGVGIALPACNTAGMLAVDQERAGMGSGLMQMTFNIPAALGLAVVTAIVGSVSSSHMLSSLTGTPNAADGDKYVEMINGGDPDGAASFLESLPAATQDAISSAWASAQASGIGLSMAILGVVAVIGAVFAYVVIGRRRVPDNIEIVEVSI